MSAGKFLAGFVVGGVVGAVVGLLLAPQSGQETRDMLARKSEELKNKAEKTVKEIQGKAEDLVSDMQKIKVNQGYCKCSTLVVKENALITDDESIYHKMRENGTEALLVSKGDIFLKEHDYGFIGGASGKISNDTIVFFGNIFLHRDSEMIISFIREHGCSYLCTDNGPLRDIGGIIPLSEMN